MGAVLNPTGGIEMTEVPSSVKNQAMDRDFQPSVRIGKTGITDNIVDEIIACLLYTSPSPRDKRQPRMPSSA